MSLAHLGVDDPGPPPEPEVSEERAAEVAREISPPPERPRKRTMLQLYAEVAFWARETMQFAWDKHAAKEDEPIVAVPEDSARLITKMQWFEAMRVAAALFTRQRVRDLGAPEAVAHPSGRAGLAWRVGDRHLTVLIDKLSGPSSFRCSYERRDPRGDAAGEISDLRELGEAVEAALCAAGSA